jgi:outer membrane protein assembly factor BamE (lipoprotein component of BamABCDE complex)
MSRSMRITSVMLVLALCLLTVACENLSQENYNKIKVGMSLQEVEKLLGSSPTCDSAVGMKNCTWGTADKHVKVQFVADKVALHSAKGLK